MGGERIGYGLPIEWKREDEIRTVESTNQHVNLDFGALQEVWRRTQHVLSMKQEKFLEAGKLGLSSGVKNVDAGRKEFENGWLLTEDYDRYDMREPVMKSELANEQVKELTQDLYRVFKEPKYLIRKLIAIRSRDDLAFAKRGVKYVFGHLKDFAQGSEMRLNAETAVTPQQGIRGRSGE